MPIDLACVERGVQLLDKTRPEWYKEINITKLDMAYLECCILGQLEPSNPIDAVHQIGTDTSIPLYALGFDIGVEDTWEDEDKAYEELKQLWIKEINVRLEKEGTTRS